MRSTAKDLHMPRLAQVGVVVRDMDSTIRQLEDVFGIGPWLVLEGETARKACTTWASPWTTWRRGWRRPASRGSGSCSGAP